MGCVCFEQHGFAGRECTETDARWRPEVRLREVRPRAQEVGPPFVRDGDDRMYARIQAPHPQSCSPICSRSLPTSCRGPSPSARPQPIRHTPFAERGEAGGRAPRLYETGMTTRSQEADRTGGVRHLCSDGATRMRRIRPLGNPLVQTGRRRLAERAPPATRLPQGLRRWPTTPTSAGEGARPH